MLSKAEIQVLNAARLVLRQTSADCRAATHAEKQDERVDGYDYGLLSATAEQAGDALFDVLNVGNSHLHIEMSHEDLHMRPKETTDE